MGTNRNTVDQTFFDSREQIMGVLDVLCENIMEGACIRPLLILGSYVSMRKAIEVMIVDLLRNFTKDKAGFKYVDIATVRERHPKTIQKQSFEKKHDEMKNLHAHLFWLKEEISVFFHYQAYRYYIVDDEYQAETIDESEYKQINNLYIKFAGYKARFCELLQEYLMITESNCYTVRSGLKDIYREIPTDFCVAPKDIKSIDQPMIVYFAKILNSYKNDDRSMLAMDTVYLCNRMIAECYGVYCVRTYDDDGFEKWMTDKKETWLKDSTRNGAYPLLNDYIEKLYSLIGSEKIGDPSKNENFRMRMGFLIQIRDTANAIDHIIGKDFSTELRIVPQEEIQSDIRRRDKVNAAGSDLLDFLARRPLPEEVRIWLEANNTEKQELIKENEKLRASNVQLKDKIDRMENDYQIELNKRNAENKTLTDKTTRIVKENRFLTGFLYFVGICVAIVAVILWNNISHPWEDPSPKLSEGGPEVTEWDETPEITVTIDNIGLEPGEVIGLWNKGSAPELLVNAKASGENSLKWALNKRFMKTINVATNDVGLAYIDCKCYTYDEDGSLVSSTKYPIKSGGSWAMAGLIPGRYMLNVQAVGAADGLKGNGKELNAATGWIEYPFIYLPKSVDWTLKNVNSNDIVEQNVRLNANAGDILEVECDSDLSGVIVYSRWDDEQEWVAVEDNQVRVPQSMFGNHVLHFTVAYEYWGEEIKTDLKGDFSIIVKGNDSPEAGTQDIQIILKDDNGGILENGSTYVAKPDDIIHVNINSSDVIEKVLIRIEHSDGQVEIKESQKTEDAQFVLKGEYGSEPITLVFGIKDGNGNITKREEAVILHIVFRAMDNEYDEEGNIVKEYIYGNAGDNNPTGYIISKYKDNRICERSFWTIDGQPTYGSILIDNDNRDYHKAETIIDDDGWKWTWLYDLDGESLIDGSDILHGASGYSYHKDEEGRAIQWYYGQQRELFMTTNGYAGVKQDYDENGNIIYEIDFDEHENPTIANRGYCVFSSQYDSAGNRTDERFYDVDTVTPCLCEGKYHHAHYTFDDNGNILTEAFYGTDDELLVRTDLGYARAEYSYDTNGHKTSEIFYDTKGAIYQEGGYAKWERTYEPGTDNELSCVYLDAEGRAVNHSVFGYAYYDCEYKNGIKTKISFRDEQGRPVSNNFGYARWEYKEEQTEEGLVKSWAYYNREGELVCPSDMDWAMREEVYDATRNHCLIRRYKGANGELVDTKDMYYAAQVEFNYAADGERTMEFYRSANGQPRVMSSKRWVSPNDSGMQQVNYCGKSYAKHPDDAHITYVRYLDENKNPIENELGVYQAKLTYDDNGNIVKEERFTRDNVYPKGETIRFIDWSYYEGSGQASSERAFSELKGTEWLYDEDGKTTSTSFYDGNGGRITDENGVWKYTWGYIQNDEKTVITQACYDIDEQLVVGPEGYAKLEMEYDKYFSRDEGVYPYDLNLFVSPHEGNYGNTYEERHYGADGNLIVNDAVGYAVFRREKTVNSLSQEFYDVRNELMVNEQVGYARFERKTEHMDNGHNVTSTSFYDADGNLVIGGNGYARLEQEFDPDDNAAEKYPYIWLDDGEYSAFYEERYYNNDGNLMINGNCGYAIYHRETSESLSTVEYKGTNDELVSINEAGVARIERRYDGEEMTSKAYYGVDGLPTLNEYGFAEERWVRYVNEGINTYDHSFINVDGSLMLNEYGTYAMEREEETDGMKKHSYFGEDENLRINPDFGYAAVVDEWTENESTHYFLNENGDKMLLETVGYGFAQRIVKLLDNGENGIEVCFCDESGNLVVPPEYGFSRVVQIEDDRGRVTEQRFYDGDKPVFVESFPVLEKYYINYETNWRYDDSTKAIIKASTISWEYDDTDEKKPYIVTTIKFYKQEEGQSYKQQEMTVQGDNVLSNYQEGIAQFYIQVPMWRWELGGVSWSTLEYTDQVIAIKRYDESGNLIE